MTPWFAVAFGLLLVAFGIRQLVVQRRRATMMGPADVRLVERLTDPREAAAILMVQAAVYSGRMSIDQKQAITSEMQEAFGVDADDAEGLFSFGRMAVGQIGDAVRSMKRLVQPILDNCTLQEMKDLIAMLERVSAVDGPPDAAQRRLISEARQTLHLDGLPQRAEVRR